MKSRLLKNSSSRYWPRTSVLVSKIISQDFPGNTISLETGILPWCDCPCNSSAVIIASAGLQFTRSVVSDSLRPHESQHVRPPCPSPTPGIHPNSCPSNRWCHPAISSSVVSFSSCSQSLPAAVFSNESTLHMRWPKYWSFSFNISPSNEHPGLISFRMDWLGFLVVQGTLKSLLQHHGSKTSILQCSAFFTVQLSHSYMTTGKTIALTRWKVMSNWQSNVSAF